MFNISAVVHLDDSPEGKYENTDMRIAFWDGMLAVSREGATVRDHGSFIRTILW